MAIERSFSIIKPDATARNITGAIIQALEEADLRIIAQKRVHWTRAQAEAFYHVHRERPFFSDLVDFMISGPIILQIVEGEDAILRNRAIMGATDPAQAAVGTIRAKYGESIERNSVHGSDSPQSAADEIALCFSDDEIVG